MNNWLISLNKEEVFLDPSAKYETFFQSFLVSIRFAFLFDIRYFCFVWLNWFSLLYDLLLLVQSIQSTKTFRLFEYFETELTTTEKVKISDDFKVYF